MGTKKLVAQLKEILSSINLQQKRYETAWLSLDDDLTGRERYVLHVQINGQLSSVSEELGLLTTTVRKWLDPALHPLFSRIVIHRDNEQIHNQSDDMLLLEDAAVY